VRRHCAHTGRVDRVTAQLHPRRSRSQRDVDPIVYEDAGGRTADCGQSITHQRQELAIGQIPLADLNDVHACDRGVMDSLEQVGARRIGRTPSIRHEADHGSAEPEPA
jgi:hypothetical protein